MTSRLESAFRKAEAEDRAALVVFVSCGDPDLETTRRLVPELVAAGADVVELGLPHSDPIAEGPTIQAASARALAAGVTTGAVLETAAAVADDAPLVIMGYINNILAHGEEAFVADAAAAGVAGLIVVDAPYDERPGLDEACRRHGVDRVLLVAPTTPPERMVAIASRSSGFVYCVSVTGVTGARSELAAGLGGLVARVKRVTDLPVAVGFGISGPEQAAEASRFADGVIVGSAVINALADGGPTAAAGLVADMAEAMAGARR